ncbi:MAG: redoxin domain-containing protein [Methanomassiliicoccales archaeon]
MSCCPTQRIVRDKIPEINPTVWLNTPALSMKDFKNKVVLFYFFSFNEGFSETTLSHLSYLWWRMRRRGLMVVGIHTPSLEKERNIEFIRDEVQHFEVDFPVAVDNDHRIWKSFRNQFYSQFHFADVHGILRHTRAGSNIEEEVELAVVHLLNEGGKKVDLGPEINGACFEGKWYVGDGFVELDGSYGKIEIRYIGKSLDIIASSPKPRKYTVLLDGKAVPLELSGKDLCLENGRSYLELSRERRFEVIRDSRRKMRLLSMTVRGKGFRLQGFCVDEGTT